MIRIEAEDIGVSPNRSNTYSDLLKDRQSNISIPIKVDKWVVQAFIIYEMDRICKNGHYRSGIYCFSATIREASKNVPPTS
jgi:hypothetical protein